MLLLLLVLVLSVAVLVLVLVLERAVIAEPYSDREERDAYSTEADRGDAHKTGRASIDTVICRAFDHEHEHEYEHEQEHEQEQEHEHEHEYEKCPEQSNARQPRVKYSTAGG